MSSKATRPVSLPSASTTGSRRTPCLRMEKATPSMVSSSHGDEIAAHGRFDAGRPGIAHGGHDATGDVAIGNHPEQPSVIVDHHQRADVLLHHRSRGARDGVPRLDRRYLFPAEPLDRHGNLALLIVAIDGRFPGRGLLPMG